MQVLPVFVAVFRRYSLRWCRLRYKSGFFTQCFGLARRCDDIMVVMKFLWVFKHVYALLLFLSASSMLPFFFRGGGGRGGGGRGGGRGRGRGQGAGAGGRGEGAGGKGEGGRGQDGAGFAGV